MKLNDLQKMLVKRKGATFLTIIAVTEAQLTEEGKEKFGRVWRVSHVNGQVNFNYENAVNKQREKEGVEEEFVARPRKWGTRLDSGPFISHVRQSDGHHELYLELRVLNVIETTYRNEKGDLMTDAQIWTYIKKNKSQLEHQMISKEIVVRDYNVKNIIAITLDNQTHLLSP